MDYQLRAPRIPQYSSVEQVLVNRGIKFEDIPHYLNTTDIDILNPNLIAHIKDGAKMLVQHISQNDKIFIQVD